VLRQGWRLPRITPALALTNVVGLLERATLPQCVTYEGIETEATLCIFPVIESLSFGVRISDSTNLDTVLWKHTNVDISQDTHYRQPACLRWAALFPGYGGDSWRQSVRGYRSLAMAGAFDVRRSTGGVEANRIRVVERDAAGYRWLHNALRASAAAASPSTPTAASTHAASTPISTVISSASASVSASCSLVLDLLLLDHVDNLVRYSQIFNLPSVSISAQRHRR
jgi:hypothetical protein